MKIAAMIARILLGALFVFAGLNGIFNFVKAPPFPPGLVSEFIDAMLKSHYTMAVGIFQAVGGLLLIVGRFVPLALTILGPIIVNILLFHILLYPVGLGTAVVVAVFWCFIAYYYRASFAPLFAPKPI
jgi:putative oxidoreductase